VRRLRQCRRTLGGSALKTRSYKIRPGMLPVLGTLPKGVRASTCREPAAPGDERRTDVPAGHPASILPVSMVSDADRGRSGGVHRPGIQLRSRLAGKGEATKILVADDDALTRRLLQKTLKQAGFEVVVVDDGGMALECLLSKVAPRLALLDWLMPGLNGLEVCREIRRHTENPYIYMILLTSRTSKEDVVKGLEAGADDYLTKPFDLEELKARLRCGQRILKLEDQLTYDALHDPLTHLPNRTYFLERLALCVSWGLQHPEYKFAVLSVDMDRFKIVNDSLGNPAGDWLLVQIAERLLGSIRGDDAMIRSAEAGGLTGARDEGGMLARLGGDKFTILLDNIRDASEGVGVAERIQRNIQTPFLIDKQKVFTSASIGIAFSGTGYSAAEDMLGDANTAMSRAKSQGKARFEMCDPAMHDTATGRFRLENDLRRATEREEFCLHYQPIVSLADRRIVGFEALVRWQRPEHGLTMPAGFIPVAEETGLILWIGNWVLMEACRQLQAWNRRFPSVPPFTVAVNISAKQFAQPDLVSHVAQTLRVSGLAPQSLKLELTESITMGHEQRTTRILGELKALGVRLCIDDFGTGYSSLSYLRRFSLDILKIDRSFVCDMLINSESREIVKTILSLGSNLSLEVVAEGVETAEQMNLLQSLGCAYGQGYFFSRALDLTGITNILLTSKANDYSLTGETPKHLVARELSSR
jgi:predicted signal transduction protein with EAL and GGDEF domain